MDELVKKVRTLSLLKKKNSLDVDNAVLKFKQADEKYIKEHTKHKILKNELDLCNQNVIRAMQDQINVEQLISINKYAEQLEVKVKEQKKVLGFFEVEKEKLKSQLLKVMSKDKIFNKVHDDSVVNLNLKINDKLNRELEDIWVSQEYK